MAGFNFEENEFDFTDNVPDDGSVPLIAVKEPYISKEYDELTIKIRELQKSINEYKADVQPITSAISSSKKEEQEEFDRFQAWVNDLRQQRNELIRKEREIERSMQDAQDQLNNMERLRALELQRKAAQEKMDALKTEFDSLRLDQPWSSKIKDYQWDDVCAKLIAFKQGKSGILNANDMGLGKTMETAVFLQLVRQYFYEQNERLPAILWLTKKSLRKSSFKEILRWVPDMQMIILDGNESIRNFQVDLAVGSNSMLIANYDALNSTPKLHVFTWDIIIMDEVHKLKGGANSKPTAIFEKAKEVCDKASFLVPLSGSPIQNHPKEMWCYLHLFDPVRFPNAKRFETEFCYGYPEVSVNWEYIIKAIKDRVIRRRKSEVLTELPPKSYNYIYAERLPEQDGFYEKMRDEFWFYLDNNADKMLAATAIIAQITRLRQINLLPSSISGIECNESGKLNEAMEKIEELRDLDEQIVVFTSQFNEPLFELERRIAASDSLKGTKTEVVTGANSWDISAIEERFQNNDTQVLLINMKTGSEGLNLQKNPDSWVGGACHAIFLDLWWNPESNRQGEDRIYREGQTDPVEIHIIQDENSVDMFIADKLAKKQNMIAGIMDSEEIRSGSDWRDYLEGLI